jgi:hypothetical protein
MNDSKPPDPDASSSPALGSSFDDPAERKAVSRYGIVLLLLLATFVFMASAPTGHWVPFVAVVLQSATLIAALRAANAGRHLMHFAYVVVVVALLGAASLWIADLTDTDGVLFVLNALLVGGAPVIIARSLVRRNVVDIHTVMGALCIYVLLGMLFAFVFGAIGAFSSAPFFAEQSFATVADFLYFSFVTLCTVGYGDLTAREGLGRAIAVIEMLTGQLYLVTVVALVVSRMGALPRRNRADG